MNKKGFVDQLSKRTGMTKKDSKEVLDSFLEIVTDALVEGDDVLFTGFGKFENRTRKATMRINPNSGEKIQVPARVRPKFRAGKNLKEGVEENLETFKDAEGNLKIRKS